MRVAVVGGGLAGITAALALQEAGAAVELFEARPRLGGATHSFNRDGLTVDNGQHVYLRCCTAYQGLLDRLGARDKVSMQDRFDITVLSPDGRSGRLRRAGLPGPLHMLPALGRYGLLGPADRLRVGRAALALRGLDPDDPALDQVSVGTWLSAHGQRERARTALWELFVTAALNTGVEDAALGAAAMVVQTALLGRADAADIGVPTVPLGDLHGTSALEVLDTVHLKSKVTAIEPGPRLTVDGQVHDVDAVVLAVPHQAAAALVPEEACPDRGRWAGLGASPIVNVHVRYDRRVTDLPFAAAIDSPVQWVFDRTAISGADSGQYLAVSVSAAADWIDVPVAEVRAVFVPALRALFPAARAARVTDLFVTRERQATFDQVPGSGALRPGPVTRMPGLVLAGAWTATGWPDTMEGAVRSGLTAARHVLRTTRTAPDRARIEGGLL